jgi:hypothetical protein
MQQSLNVWRWRSEILLVRSALFLLNEAGPFEVSPDLHCFFVDRYLRLAHHHRKHGRVERAERLFAKACMHWIAVDPDEPPPAIAAVMPVPLPPIFTWAVADHHDRQHRRKAA